MPSKNSIKTLGVGVHDAKKWKNVSVIILTFTQILLCSFIAESPLNNGKTHFCAPLTAVIILFNFFRVFISMADHKS